LSRRNIRWDHGSRLGGHQSGGICGTAKFHTQSRQRDQDTPKTAVLHQIFLQHGVGYFPDNIQVPTRIIFQQELQRQKTAVAQLERTDTCAGSVFQTLNINAATSYCVCSQAQPSCPQSSREVWTICHLGDQIFLNSLLQARFQIGSF